ncbi:MAG: glycosyltransferase family 39 protein [Bacillus sp. (in: Bacteria)]|nr:glycosyltransferase family 39 protein [Bacillus sp. (in: firmicutes)]
MEQTHLAHKSDTSQKRLTLQGRQGNPAWERPALIILLVITAIAYIWGLNKSGWSNSFYSAAVQAATKSWKAFFFGSIDSANFITVDKPPASLWVMDLSARIFGLNSWSILVPEALEGVACVWILYLAVRRWFSAGAALLAGAVLAITPVAALMFRFNNPDALLVLLLTASAYSFIRALEEGKTKWLVWSSVLIGFGFLTKMLAAFFVIPGFVFVYLLFAPVSVRKRIVQIIISAITVIVSAGWWVAIVELIPASARPFIGSSQKNSILDLIFGYNGLGRLTGNESGMGGNGGGRTGAGMSAFGGNTGLTRLFNSEMGGQISWLIPAALILFLVSLWLIRRQWRSHRAFPALLMWAATFFITGILFSFGSGTIHQYYTIALAPSIGAIIGIAVEVLWQRREEWMSRLALAVATLSTAIWAFVLLYRTPTWLPVLRIAILIIGIIAAVAILFGPTLNRKLANGAAVAAIVACLAGPLAYTIQTISTAHTGSTPTAGPTITNAGFRGNFGGNQGPSGYNSGHSNGDQPQMPSSSNSNGDQPQMPSSSNSNGGQPQMPGSYSAEKNGNTNRTGFHGGFESTPSKTIVKLLKQHASKYTWVAATVSAQSSASYQLATDKAIMDIGGFTGSDPAPTLSEFKKYVKQGKIHYFISNGRGSGRGMGQMGGNFPNRNNNGSKSNKNFKGNFNGPMGGNANVSSSITNWVQKNFKSKTVDGVTVYDLTQAKS